MQSSLCWRSTSSTKSRTAGGANSAARPAQRTRNADVEVSPRDVRGGGGAERRFMVVLTSGNAAPAECGGIAEGRRAMRVWGKGGGASHKRRGRGFLRASSYFGVLARPGAGHGLFQWSAAGRGARLLVQGNEVGEWAGPMQCTTALLPQCFEDAGAGRGAATERGGGEAAPPPPVLPNGRQKAITCTLLFPTLFWGKGHHRKPTSCQSPPRRRDHGWVGAGVRRGARAAYDMKRARSARRSSLPQRTKGRPCQPDTFGIS